MIESHEFRKRIVESLVAREYPKEIAEEVAFHLVDWSQDFEQFAAFKSTPNDYDARQVEKLLVSFLVHVPNHLAAASKLLTGIPVTDIFKVGAVSEDQD